MRPEPTREASSRSPQRRKEPELLCCAYSFRGTRKTTGQGRGGAESSTTPACARQNTEQAAPLLPLPENDSAKKMRTAADGGPQNDAQGQAFQPWTPPCANGRAAERRSTSGRCPPRPADVFTSSARILRPPRPLISKPLLHSRRSSAPDSGPKIQGGALPFPRLPKADRQSRPPDSSPPCKEPLPESPGHPPPETKNPRSESPPTGIISTLIEVRTDRTHGPAQTPRQDQAEASLLLCNTLSSSRKITSSAPLTSRQIQGLELTKPATR